MTTMFRPGARRASIALAAFASLGMTVAQAQTPSAPPPAPADAWTMPTDEAPLGTLGMVQTITTKPVTPGVTYYQIKRGAPSPTDYWTVSTGFYPSVAVAQVDVDALAKAGIATRIDPSPGQDLAGKPLGVWLSSGQYPTEEAARQAAASIAKATNNAVKPVARNISLAGKMTTGPWIINVVAITPAKTNARLVVALPGGNNLGGDGETVSAAAARTKALVAMNGGFFSNINPFNAKLPPRSPVGATVIDGRLVAAANARPGVAITTTTDGHPKVMVLANMTTKITLADAQGATTAISTIDRPILGTVVNCGSQAEGKITVPAQDYVCTNNDDLVLYDDLYLRGRASNTQVDAGYHGETYELLVGADGAVVAGHPTLGAAPPHGGYVLQGLGKNAAWLRNHAAPGTKLTVTRELLADGKEIKLEKGLSVIEAGPTLVLRDLLAHAATEGFSPALNGSDAGDSAGTAFDNWYNGWVVARNPRTTIGTAADGTILLVEVDGRQPSLSVGTSIAETDALMKWLGATAAVNLDGGGSSNMVVNGTTVGHPSDTAGERGVGDTVLLLPPAP